MDKIIVTILLVVAGIVCSMVVLNAVYPVISESSSAIVDAAGRIDDRIRSNVEIIEVAHNGSDLYVWVKNVGASSIRGVNASDIFFGPQGNFARISYGGGTAPYWEYNLENDTRWGPTATIKISIHYSSPISGEYYFKAVMPNGISCQKYYSAS